MPESVQAQGGNYLHQKIADTTVTLLDFPSGIRAHIFVSWLHPFKEQKLVVVGDRQMAVFDDTVPWAEKLKIYPHTISWSDNVPVASKAEARLIEVAQDEPLRAECAHFLECSRKSLTPRTDGLEGLRVLKVLNACQLSLERERKVELNPAEEKLEYFVHETAMVEAGVSIGAGVRIWHFSHVLSGSVIGPACNIGQNVVIGPRCTMGTDCKIQNNVSVYKGVILEDDVFCGPSMVFTNVINPRCEFPGARMNSGPPWSARVPAWGPTAPSSAATPSALTPLSGPGRWWSAMSPTRGGGRQPRPAEGLDEPARSEARPAPDRQR